MSDHQAIKIGATFQVEVVEAPELLELSPALEERVKAYWKKVKEESQKPIFNGKVFTVVAIEADRLKGQFVDYKLALARYQMGGLEDSIHLRSVGVSGVTVAREEGASFERDKILLGKRSESVTGYPGFWEFAPSGAIDPSSREGDLINYRQQLLSEMVEEIALEESAVKNVVPVSLVFDADHKVWDICMEMMVDPSSAELPKRSEEFDQFQWIPRGELLNFLESERERVVPTSRLIYESYLRDR